MCCGVNYRVDSVEDRSRYSTSTLPRTLAGVDSSVRLAPALEYVDECDISTFYPSSSTKVTVIMCLRHLIEL